MKIFKSLIVVLPIFFTACNSSQSTSELSDTSVAKDYNNNTNKAGSADTALKHVNSGDQPIHDTNMIPSQQLDTPGVTHHHSSDATGSAKDSSLNK